MGRQLGPLRNDGAIDVTNGIPLLCHESHRLVQKDVAAGALPFGVVIREELANVGQRKGAEDGIDHGMEENVAV
jgi:hypothetical protein